MPTPNPRSRTTIPATGHEPAKGFPDPRAVVIPATQATHRVNPNGGTICGIKPVPMNAAAYNDENPTCPTCADWLAKVRAHTYGKYGAPAQHGSSAIEAPVDAAEPPTAAETPEAK